MGNLEADGEIVIYDIETGAIIATYEGLEVHEIMLAWKADQQAKVRQSKQVCPDCHHPITEHCDAGCSHEPFCSCRNSGESLRYGRGH